MIKFLVKRPIAVVVSFFALLLLGVSAYTQLPTTLLPEADIPRLSVQVPVPNTSARTIEQNVVSRLRSALMHMHGLEHIESKAREGEGSLELLFEHGINLSLAFLEVNERVDKAMNGLPEDVQRPLVHKASVADIPIFRLNIYSRENDSDPERFAEISSFSKEIIKRRLEQLPEISTVDISGFTQPQVQIIPKEDYLGSLHISRNRLYQALRENKLNLGSILVQDGHYQYYLKFNSDLLSLEEIRNTPLNISGRLFRLKDLARIQLAYAEAEGAFISGHSQAINLAIMKQSSAKVDDLKAGFNRLLREFKREYPDLVFEVVNDQTSLLNFSIQNLQQDLILGGILAFLFMLIFIRKIRAALLIGITIPVTLIVSMLGFYLMNIDLNIISLGGLILGLAMIIDNSIVVIDSINRYKEEEAYDNETAAVQGTGEIIRPMIASVLTNCAVFVPLIFLSGIAGVIFYDQALSITIGMVSSLLVAVALLPPLYVLLYKLGKGKREIEVKSMVNVTAWYERGLAITFKYPLMMIAMVCALLFGAVVLFNVLPKERLPPTSQHDFVLHINWNEGIALNENRTRVNQLIQAGDSLITLANAWVGRQQYLFMQDADLSHREAKLYLQVSGPAEVDQLKEQLEEICQRDFPRALLSFAKGDNPFNAIFAHTIAPLRLQLTAPARRDLPPPDTAIRITQRLSARFPHAFINPVALHDQMVLTVKAERAALYDINAADIKNALENALKPRFVDYFQGAQALVPMVFTRMDERSVSQVLNSSTVQNRNGTNIPLTPLVDVRYGRAYETITAGKSGPFYPIAIYSDHAGRDIEALESIVQSEAGAVDAEITGSYFSDQALIKEMALIFLVAILLLYFILAAQFESLIQPLFVLVELPIALFGAFLFLFIAGNSLNVMSMIGLIVMSGLIINDSILKIDAINQLRRGGTPLMQAIYDGGHKRLKPIIMISLTSVGALLPTLFMSDLGSELQKPLALALIGGMLVGMLVSLFFVPLIYWFIYRKYEDTNTHRL